MALGLSGLSIGTQLCCSHATAALLRFDSVTSLLVNASLILSRRTPSLASRQLFLVWRFKSHAYRVRRWVTNNASPDSGGIPVGSLGPGGGLGLPC